MWMGARDESIFVFGGQGDEGPATPSLCDLWRYNLRETRWESVPVLGDTLPPMQEATVLRLSDVGDGLGPSVLIFGGYCGDQINAFGSLFNLTNPKEIIAESIRVFGDREVIAAPYQNLLFRFYLDTSVFLRVKIIGDVPLPTAQAFAVEMGPNTVTIGGGYGLTSCSRVDEKFASDFAKLPPEIRKELFNEENPRPYTPDTMVSHYVVGLGDSRGCGAEAFGKPGPRLVHYARCRLERRASYRRIPSLAQLCVWHFWFQGGDMASDSYYGPLSCEAFDLLKDAGAIQGDPAAPTTMRVVEMDGKKDHELADMKNHEYTYFPSFRLKLERRDSVRAKVALKRLKAAATHRASGCLSMRWTLRVELANVYIGGRKIWRTLTVAPDITLAALHDQALAPALGWRRNYHAYAFQPFDAEAERRADEADDTEPLWIGPVHSTALDMKHLPLYIGGAFIDDRKLHLFEAMSGEIGSSLSYVYDLGDWWAHCVSLVDVTTQQPGEDPRPPVEFLDGWGAVPSEDTGGPANFARRSERLFTPPEPDNPPDDCFMNSPEFDKWWEALIDIRGRKLHYDHSTFSLEEARHRVSEALARPTDPSTDSDFMMQHPTSIGPNGLLISGSKASNTLKEPPQGRVCALCGVVMTKLKSCGRCRAVHYCCQQHQQQDWKRHKPECLPK